MYAGSIGGFQHKNVVISCWMLLIARFILLVDTTELKTSSINQQTCSKLQSMLSYGKYQTSQITSNVTYASRPYAQNFLAYSPMDDLLIFIEPQHQISVYDAQTIKLLANLSTTDVVIATSSSSLITDSRRELYFMYQTSSDTNLISLRVCQVRFNMLKLTFEHSHCIETIVIQYDRSFLPIHGFTIKRDHARTKKSLLFISTHMGIIYTVFDTSTGSIVGESLVLNETLNEGSIALSSSGSIYYASRQENLVYEIHISRDFRLHYGNITKSNAIKSPFGLITDECNHLYIATRSTILILYVQTFATIRSVFSKASDLPTTLERLNATTYVYATIKRNSGKAPAYWMFNFLYFTDPDKPRSPTRHPVVKYEEKLDFNSSSSDNTSIPVLWPITYSFSPMTNGTRMYMQFFSTPRNRFSRFKKKKRKQKQTQAQTTISIDQKTPTIDPDTLSTQNPLRESTTDVLPEYSDSDENLEMDDDPQSDYPDQADEFSNIENQSDISFQTNTLPNFSSNSLEPAIPLDVSGQDNSTLIRNSPPVSSVDQPSDSQTDPIFTLDDIQSYLEGRKNYTFEQEVQMQTYLTKYASKDESIFSKYSKNTKLPNRIFGVQNNSQSKSHDNSTSFEKFLTKQPLSDSDLSADPSHRISDAVDIKISEDDLQSYLKGSANLSSSRKSQIEAFLNRQSSRSPHSFSKHSENTTKPTEVELPEDGHSMPDILSRNQYSHLESYLKNFSLSLPHYFNHTQNMQKLLFSANDLQSYLQGRANLSLSQERQIQAYLASHFSPNQTIGAVHATSTKKPRKSWMFQRPNQLPFQRTKNESVTDDVQLTDYSEELLFSDDDLQSYLQGRANLSLAQEAQIQAYLDAQVAFDHNQFSNYSKNSKTPSKTVTAEKDRHLDRLRDEIYSQKYLTKSPLSSRKDNNLSKDSEKLLLTYEDLQSYLEGRANLSSAQEAQIQNYLAEQTSTDSSWKKLPSTLLPTTRKRPNMRRPSGVFVNGSDGAKQLSDDYFDSHLNEDIYTDTIDDHGQSPTLTSSKTDPSITVTKEPPFDHDGNYTKMNDYVDSVDDKSNLSATTITVPTNTTYSDVITDHISQIDKNGTLYSNEYNQQTVDQDNRTRPLHEDNQTQLPSFNINNISFPSVVKDDTSSQNQSHWNGTTISSDRSKLNLNESITIKAYPTLSTPDTSVTEMVTTTSDDFSRDTDDRISHTHSSPMLVDIDIFSTHHLSLSSVLSNATLSPLQLVPSSSPLHQPDVNLSTETPESPRFSSSTFFSETGAILSSSSSESMTTEPLMSTSDPSATGTLQSSLESTAVQTTDEVITSDTSTEETRTTLSDSFSSPAMISFPYFPSSVSSEILSTMDEHSITTNVDQSSSKPSDIYLESSTVPQTESTEPFADEQQSTRIAFEFDPSTIVLDKTVTPSSESVTSERSFETTGTLKMLPISSLPFFDKYEPKVGSSKSLLESTSTSSPSFRESKAPWIPDRFNPDAIPRPITSISTPTVTTTRRYRTGKQKITRWTTQELSTTSSSTTTTTTTTRRYRTGKQKITRWRTQEVSRIPSTTTMIPSPSEKTIPINDLYSSTTTQETLRHSQQQPVVLTPSSTKNDSNRYLSTDTLNRLLNNIPTSTNSSTDKLVYFNLVNLPPSSWNLSIISNESIGLDIALPTATYPSNSNTTTNLTFTTIEANRFSTNIVGIPVHLQVDRVYAKRFSLKMNATANDLNPNRTNRHSSDVIIGHVKSEQFELNLTKSDNMHVHVRQVDAATAELYLDSNFCTNESSLEINLNLSKNGTIRYGNRTAIRIGPVFTRVHMLKQSCGREQPLALFFDLCERQNPCMNKGTCQSLIPDYNDASYAHSTTGSVGYKCNCPTHTSGDHCQHSRYPFGYCLQGGTVYQSSDVYNHSLDKCLCPLGFSGEHCEHNINDCRGVVCSHHGMCEDGINNHTCSCFDGFSGRDCEKTNVKTVLLQVASRSFGIIAILLIASIAGLVVASDIHTYVTRQHQKNSALNRIARPTSELFENSVLLLGFGNAPIEMSDLSTVGAKRKPVVLKPRLRERTTVFRKSAAYRPLSRRRLMTTVAKPSVRR